MSFSVCRALRVVFCAVLLSGFASLGWAQQSNGLTYYKVAGPASVDTSGNVLTGAANNYTAYQTDGTTVVFLNRTGTDDESEVCGAGWGLYTTPVGGGAITPLVTSTTQVEASEPAGTAVQVCDNPVLVGGMVYYAAQYTGSGGTLRSGIFRTPLAGGTSADVVATGDTVAGAGLVATVDATDAFLSEGGITSAGFPKVNLFVTQFEVANAEYSYILTVPLTGAATATATAPIACNGYTLYPQLPGYISSDGNGLTRRPR